MSEIIININEANKAQKYQNENELFQIDAFKRVTEILKEHKVGNDTSDITDCRFHDTIFIDGDRGVGKTAFMINIENYYKNIAKIETPKYIFLKPVDPTLLEHTEKFLSVVLARIVEYVNDNKQITEKGFEEKYFTSLENLSKSLSSIKTLPDDIGIDEIASNKSSLKLEQHSHDFFKEVCSIFGTDGIVMLIDDVDMAFDKGFDVLEVVRKYLASPYLIPIVAGDMKLYREIVETRFMDKIDFNKDISAYSQMKNIFEKGCSDIKEINKNWENTKLGCDHRLLIQNREELKEKRNLIQNLVKQYLEKLFPNEYHIKLKDIFSILKEKNVQIKFPKNLIVPYTEVKDFEIRHINLGINQVEFTYKIFSNNTRDLIQYLYSKKEIYSYFFTKNNTYSKNSEHKKYIPQNVIKKYDNNIMDMILNEKELYKKSLEITSKIYEFGDTKQKELSKLIENDVNAYRSRRYHIYNAFLGNVFENTKLNTEEGKESISILYSDFDKVKSFQGKEKYIVDLFVHSNYYSNTNKTKNYIFAGSFIELMFFSFTSNYKLELKKDSDSINILNFNEEISIDMTLNDKFEEIKKCYDLSMVDTDDVSQILDEISYKVPFNSIFRKNKNFESDSKNSDEEEILTSISHDKSFLEELAKEILVWRNTFLDDIKINSISMYEIMHKFFNNLNILKNQLQNQKLLIDVPLHFMQRVVYIFINAVAFFENTERRVAQTNIAMNEKFDMQILLKNSNAFNQNIKLLLNQKSLTRALFSHPIISHILFPNQDSKLYNLRFVSNKNSNKTQVDLKSVNEILENYYDYNLKALQINHKINLLENLLNDITDIQTLKDIAKVENFTNRFLSEHNRTATEEQLLKFNNLRQNFNNKIK